MSASRFDDLNELIGHYLAGELSPQLTEQVRAVLEADPGRRGIVAGIRAAARGEDLSMPLSVEAKEMLHRRLLAEIDGRVGDPMMLKPEHRSTPRIMPRVRRRLTGGMTAAVGAMLAGVAFILWTSRPPQSSSSIYITQIAQRAVVTLESGARVTLAPQSVLTVTGAQLTLTGQALFEFPHHDATPVTIHTGDVTTRILGTTFTLRRYAGESETRVVVTEGKVTSGGRHRVILAAGQSARVTDSSAVTSVTDDASRAIDWTTGVLDFHKAPAGDMLDMIGHWYGLQFRVADSTLARERVDARFEGQSVQDVLTALRTLLHVTMTFDTNTPGTTIVTLRPDAAIGRTGRIRRNSFTMPREAGR